MAIVQEAHATGGLGHVREQGVRLLFQHCSPAWFG
jgi:hypothetical protein